MPEIAGVALDARQAPGGCPARPGSRTGCASILAAALVISGTRRRSNTTNRPASRESRRARDVVHIGEGQRAGQFEDPDGGGAVVEQPLLVRLAAAALQPADVIFGDDAGAHVVGAVQHMQIEMRRQRLA